MNEKNSDTCCSTDVVEMNLQAGMEARNCFTVSGSSDEFGNHLVALYAASSKSDEEDLNCSEVPVSLPFSNPHYNGNDQMIGFQTRKNIGRKRSRSILGDDGKLILKKLRLEGIDLTEIISIGQDNGNARKSKTLEADGNQT